MSSRVDHLCKVMHDAYEQAAVDAGWATQQASRKPWVDVPEANKVTMRASVQALLNELEPVHLTRRGPDNLLEAAAASGTPMTAAAHLRPCELYTDHGSATPVITQGHHLYPVFLQNRVYGEIRLPKLMWLCGTCHDSVHAQLYWLLGERAAPQVLVPRRARQRALTAFEWYSDATKAA